MMERAVPAWRSQEEWHIPPAEFSAPHMASPQQVAAAFNLGEKSWKLKMGGYFKRLSYCELS